MTVSRNERLAAVAIVATNGNLEIAKRDPFTARVTLTERPILLTTFEYDRLDTTVLELAMPLMKVTPSALLDHWIARVAPKLFNVYVTARDSGDGTIIEARSSLIGDGLTVETFKLSLQLLATSATMLTEGLEAVIELSDRSPKDNCAAPAHLPLRRQISHANTASHTSFSFDGYL